MQQKDKTVLFRLPEASPEALLNSNFATHKWKPRLFLVSRDVPSMTLFNVATRLEDIIVDC